MIKLCHGEIWVTCPRLKIQTVMGTAARVWSSVLILIFLLRLLQNSAAFSQEEPVQIIFLSPLRSMAFSSIPVHRDEAENQNSHPPGLSPGDGICFWGPSEPAGGASASFCQPPGDDSSWTWVSVLCPSSGAPALCHHLVFCRVLPPGYFT